MLTTIRFNLLSLHYLIYTELVNHSFYFAHFNLMVESGPTGKNQFCLPCELAVLKYSLAQGICEVYHEFVDPGESVANHCYNFQLCLVFS